jgi:hypothetical protein
MASTPPICSARYAKTFSFTAFPTSAEAGVERTPSRRDDDESDESREAKGARRSSEPRKVPDGGISPVVCLWRRRLDRSER